MISRTSARIKTSSGYCNPTASSSPMYTRHDTHHFVRFVESGILHALLDFDLYMDSPYVRPKHRNAGCAAQSAICHHDFAGRPHLGAKRCRACLEHGTLRAIRKSGQPRLDQVLLDGSYPSTCGPGIHPLHRDQVDV